MLTAVADFGVEKVPIRIHFNTTRTGWHAMAADRRVRGCSITTTVALRQRASVKDLAVTSLE